MPAAKTANPPHPDPAEIAEGVVQRLALLARPDHKTLDPTGCFSHFYLHSTQNWIRQTRGQPGERFVGLLIGNFFRLYEVYALEPDAAKYPSPAPHWQRYLGLLERAKTARTLAGYYSTLLLLRAARAHIRHDLCEAILTTCRQYRDIYGTPPEPPEIEALIFCRTSDQVFQQAALNYHAGCAKGKSATLFTHFLARAPRIWLPLLQTWRQQAWQDAQARM